MFVVNAVRTAVYANYEQILMHTSSRVANTNRWRRWTLARVADVRPALLSYDLFGLLFWHFKRHRLHF